MTYDDRNRLGSTMAWRHLPIGRIGFTLDEVCKTIFESGMEKTVTLWLMRHQERRISVKAPLLGQNETGPHK